MKEPPTSSALHPPTSDSSLVHLSYLVVSFFFHPQLLHEIWLETGSDEFKPEKECLTVNPEIGH